MIIIKNRKNNKGFIAMISLIILAFSSLTMFLMTYGAVVSYADSVNREEIRIQAHLNLSACKERAVDILESDYFVEGSVEVKELGCQLLFVRSSPDHIVSIYATTSMKYMNSEIRAVWTGGATFEVRPRI